MTKIFNVIRENTMASWTVAVVTGFLYYFGYAIGRAIIRPLVKRIMLGYPEFFLDPLTGPIVGREALLNIFESAIVAIPVGIILSILLCTTFQKKATIYGIASILIFVLMFAILISLRLSSENDPLWWIRIIKPISAAIVFGVILWLMTKTKFSLIIGSTGSPKNPAPGEPERWAE